MGMKATDISLDKTELTLAALGGSHALSAAVMPINAVNQNIIWASSDENIATVENGIVTPLRQGEVVITATAEDGGYQAECLITVGSPVLKLGDVSGNGRIDIGDAIIILRHIVGLINIEADYGPEALARAKVSGGEVDIDVLDAILVLQFIVGKITDFPAESHVITLVTKTYYQDGTVEDFSLNNVIDNDHVDYQQGVVEGLTIEEGGSLVIDSALVM